MLEKTLYWIFERLLGKILMKAERQRKNKHECQRFYLLLVFESIPIENKSVIIGQFMTFLLLFLRHCSLLYIVQQPITSTKANKIPSEASPINNILSTEAAIGIMLSFQTVDFVWISNKTFLFLSVFHLSITCQLR